MDSDIPSPMKLPHVALACKLIEEEKKARGNTPPDIFWNTVTLPDYKESDADGLQVENLETRMIALDVSSSVVGLFCPALRFKSLRCSGIIVDFNGWAKIISSADILGGHVEITEVEVRLPNKEKVSGYVYFVDKQYNIAFISADLHNTGMKAATLDDKLMKLGDQVTAVGRHHSSKLMASRGRINIRGDSLTCDDLCSSSCSIPEWGIGGPMIDNDSQKVVGMNFYGSSSSAPFLPSSILITCIQHYLNFGKIVHPSIGLKLRSINDLEICALELLYHKLNSKIGLIVKKVTKGSPADEAGICEGDVITSCNGSRLSSPVELTSTLFKVYSPLMEDRRRSKRKASAVKGNSPRMEGRCGSKRKAEAGEVEANVVEVVVLKGSTGNTESLTISVGSSDPHTINQWPLLPPKNSSPSFRTFEMKG